MVKIINGNIIQDDDPRLQHPFHGRNQGSSSHTNLQPSPSNRVASAAHGGRLTFDWSLPPLTLLPSEDGRLPDVGVFGVAVPAIGLIGVVAAGLFLGWRGLIGGVVIGYLYLANRRPSGAPGSQPAAPSNNLLQQMQLGLGLNVGINPDPVGSIQRQVTQQKSSSPWAKLGKGQKLGSE